MSWIVDHHTAIICAGSLFIVCLASRFSKRKLVGGIPLPPGPAGLPFLGNVLSINSQEPWETYAAWGAQYGDLVYARFVNQDVVIINSEKIAKDLLEKRSSNYSDRPYLPTRLPFGWTHNFAFTPYGNEWRLARRLFHQGFRAEASLTFRPMQIRKSYQLLTNLLESPQNFSAHLTTFSSSIAMSATYDYETAPTDDPIVSVVEKANNLGLQYMTPETTLILNIFPFLLHLPSWFPGATMKRNANLCTKYGIEMVETPIEYVQKNMAAGTAGPSLVSDLLRMRERQDPDRLADFDAALRQSSASAFSGGSETVNFIEYPSVSSHITILKQTSTMLLIFILAMVLHPHVQVRARAELDAVVGKHRLPDYSDRLSLPYIEAIIREVARWQPMVPLAIAHAATNSDVYEGFYIPKGTTVIANAWAMARNEAVYPQATEFIPERFLDASGQLLNAEASTTAFGFGRRTCPGRHLADASLYIAIASTLALFEFSKAKDDQGREIDFVPKYTVGVTRHPDPFPCRIVPRPGVDGEKLAAIFDPVP
ncbi:cytochrome P450 [Hygrophoropsis aurantiaca]|uniref:Cytochrome P450 n=1 Tax=Hygrophoropsis aurantiaca TaxID=72124 RepID=A0ACB7ZXA4_9AGAM|nr:cytochrome P450 [Hygrophoropsis aurantiaca]